MLRFDWLGAACINDLAFVKVSMSHLGQLTIYTLCCRAERTANPDLPSETDCILDVLQAQCGAEYDVAGDDSPPFDLTIAVRFRNRDFGQSIILALK